MKRVYFGEPRKIRSISVDSDVIIDVPALKVLQARARLNKEEKKYVRRCEFSFQLLSLASAVKVDIVGTEIIKRELSLYSALKDLYGMVFDRTILLYPEIKRLAKNYVDKRNLKAADSLILASISIGRIDCFLSWNREHMVNALTIEAVRGINKSKGLPAPLMITPEDFLSRITLSQDQTICFFPDPIPQQFRLQFYPSRRLL